MPCSPKKGKKTKRSPKLTQRSNNRMYKTSATHITSDDVPGPSSTMMTSHWHVALSKTTKKLESHVSTSLGLKTCNPKNTTKVSTQVQGVSPWKFRHRNERGCSISHFAMLCQDLQRRINRNEEKN